MLFAMILGKVSSHLINKKWLTLSKTTQNQQAPQTYRSFLITKIKMNTQNCLQQQYMTTRSNLIFSSSLYYLLQHPQLIIRQTRKMIGLNNSNKNKQQLCQHQLRLAAYQPLKNFKYSSSRTKTKKIISPQQL